MVNRRAHQNAVLQLVIDYYNSASSAQSPMWNSLVLLPLRTRQLALVSGSWGRLLRRA